MDKYYIYRPMLDLLGKSEGTDKGRGYNETLSYGAYTGGPVDLVKMTLTSVDVLQTKMLKHPKNSWKSSAVGRYQIVRTTLRQIKETLNLHGAELFNEEMQDRMGCYLLGLRGIDKWLGGRLSQDTLINNLAKEWASIPNTQGKGHYSGQNAGVTLDQVKTALAAVKTRASSKYLNPETPPAKMEPLPKVEPKKGFWQWFLSLWR